MRNLKFILSALAILLAGAMAAGLAARAVAAPRTGETVSAGVVAVPSVLGQTADEALFYPWGRYDMLTLVPLPLPVEPHCWSNGELMACVEAVTSLGAEFNWQTLLESLVWNQSDLRAADAVFLKDFPATLGDGVPVLLNYSLNMSSPLSVSWFLEPQERQEPTEEEQQAALDKVEADLEELLRYYWSPDPNAKNDLAAFIEDFGRQLNQWGVTVFYDWFAWILEMLYQQYQDVSGLPAGAVTPPGSPPPLEEPYQQFQDVSEQAVNRPGSPLPLEEFPAVLAGMGVEIQFITTPGQVLVLFSAEAGYAFGVYYDIQLERYSGLGISN